MEIDEEKLMSRRRMEKWIKIFLVFLACVWLCTIISKSIYVSGLAVVKTDTPSKKYVEHVVEADGIVTTGGEIAVNTQSGLRVDRLYVMQGDAVKAGDVLFTIDLRDIADIISAKETELSKLQCNLSDIQVNAVIDAQKKEVELLWAQEDYETADKETLTAKERAKEALDQAEAELGKHLADPVPYTSDNSRREAWDDYHDWVNRGYSITDQVTAKEREIRDLEEQLAWLGQNRVLSGAAGDSAGAGTDAGADNSGTEADGTTDSGAGDTSAGHDDNSGGDNSDTDKDTDGDANAGGNADDADNDTDDNDTVDDDTAGDDGSDGNDSNDGNDGNDGSGDADNSAGADDNPADDADNLGKGDDSTADPPADDKDQDLTDEEIAARKELQERIRRANAELLALQDALTKHGRGVVEQPDFSAEELKFDEWQNTRLALEANVQKAKENYNDVSYSREVTLRQKQRDIASAQVTERADSTAAIYELDIKQIQAQLASLYALKKQKGEIKAESDGIISKIQVEVGGRTSDTAAVLMTDMQRPCQFKFSITKEQGKHVHLNDTVSLKLNGQSEMEVTVDYFTENMQNGYDLVCMLPEGVGKPGLSGTVQKSVQGEYHDLTLPVDVVTEESGGYFIYTLNEKEGILGSEYYVERLKVQVKDKNDRFAAIESGTISADTKVVIHTTKELKQGESVRPQEK
ncbi:MAG: biotin/lipoyl-binding protein [Lachnospiraceae bacterium]|jgi:multidrug efflux pump subunit AcrA (membrane-fusion protein)|nr:biotin/lipoyl-binding protein [Lachnospiraceae bacterium]